MPEILIRDARKEDAGTLLRLVKELAAFERAPDAVVATEADYVRDGFGPERRFEAILAHVDDRPAAYAIFFPNWSTWQGRAGLYLEDIYVCEWARRYGVGRRLMRHLAGIALARGWTRFDFQVLSWNSARHFYHALGFGHRDEWLPYRLDGEALAKFAAGEG